MDVLMCKFNSKTARFGLSKKRIAELFGVDVRTVNEHLQNIFKSGELEKEATIRKIRIVQQEGSREEYMTALEMAGVKGDITDFALFLASLLGGRTN